MGPEDLQLAEGVRRRDPAALRRAVQLYLPQLLRAARGAGLEIALAEDTVQNVFEVFLTRAEQFDGRSTVRTWLFGILYHKIHESRRALRKEAREDPIDAAIENRFDTAGSWSRPPQSLEFEVEQKETLAAVEDCLTQVPDRQKEAFLLREVESFTTEEVCKIMDLSRTNLGVMLFRARNRLRECLESKGLGRGRGHP
jgi:RNA polymerase sigma-70 factor (ECF subfamily)